MMQLIRNRAKLARTYCHGTRRNEGHMTKEMVGIIAMSSFWLAGLCAQSESPPFEATWTKVVCNDCDIAKSIEAFQFVTESEGSGLLLPTLEPI